MKYVEPTKPTRSLDKGSRPFHERFPVRIRFSPSGEIRHLTMEATKQLIKELEFVVALHGENDDPEMQKAKERAIKFSIEQKSAEYLSEKDLRILTSNHSLQCRCGYCMKLLFIIKD